MSKQAQRFSTMPVKKQARGRGKGSAAQRGEGFFGDVLDGLKAGAKAIGGVAGDLLKKVKPSDVLGLVPDPRAQAAALAAKKVGLGKKKKPRRKVARRGEGFADSVGKVLGHYAFGEKRGGSKGISHYGSATASYDKHPRIIKQKAVAQGFYTVPMSINSGVGPLKVGTRV